MESESRAPIGRFLDGQSLTQREVAAGIGRTESYVSMLAAGGVGASQDTISALLTFLSIRLRRRVTYEEVFGEPVAERSPSPEAA